MTGFDLTTEPWIQCLDLQGKRRTLGLRELFTTAHELRGLANESPLVDAAVLRTLLAILHRCVGPADDVEWGELFEAPQLPHEKTTSYLQEWAHRFDLFHPKTPFFQVAGLLRQSSNYPKGLKPARELIAEQSKYGGPRDLFESRPDDFAGRLTCAAAARWLIAIQAFHPGGLLSRDPKNGDPTAAKSGLLCSSAVVSIQGDSLRETLILNLTQYPSDSTQKDDAPAWEQAPQVKCSTRTCRGLLDRYTWQSRRIELVQGAGGVEQFLLLAGTEVKGGEGSIDPMCAYKRHEKLGMLPLGLFSERATWRDSSALYQIQGDKDLRAPLTVEELASRLSDRRFRYRLRVEGQMPNKASIVITRAENLPLPADLISRAPLVGKLRGELKRCENTQKALRKATYSALSHVLAIGDRSPDAADIGNLTTNSQVSLRFWARMKPLFETMLDELPNNPDMASVNFQRAMRDVAWSEYERAVLAAGPESRVLKGLVLGRRTLSKALSDCGLPSHASAPPTKNAENSV